MKIYFEWIVNDLGRGDASIWLTNVFCLGDIARLLLKKIAEFDLGTRSWTPAPTIQLDVSDQSGEEKHISKPKPKAGDIDDDGPMVNERRTTKFPRRKGPQSTLYPPIDIDEPIQRKKIIET